MSRGGRLAARVFGLLGAALLAVAALEALVGYRHAAAGDAILGLFGLAVALLLLRLAR